MELALVRFNKTIKRFFILEQAFKLVTLYSVFFLVSKEPKGSCEALLMLSTEDGVSAETACSILKEIVKKGSLFIVLLK